MNNLDILRAVAILAVFAHHWLGFSSPQHDE